MARALLVLSAPRAVFVALRRDDPDESLRPAEPVLAIVLLAGHRRSCSRLAPPSHLMDDPDYDWTLVAVWAFLAGGIYGVFAYWVLGGVLHGSSVALGSAGSYRRARQVLAFAAVPVALSLVLWPVKLALYGERRCSAAAAPTPAAAPTSSRLIWLGVRASGRRRCS